MVYFSTDYIRRQNGLELREIYKRIRKQNIKPTKRGRFLFLTAEQVEAIVKGKENAIQNRTV